MMDTSAYIKSALESHHGNKCGECWWTLLMTKHKTMQWQKTEEQETVYVSYIQLPLKGF